MADVTLAHRRPTIQIARVPGVEVGAALALYWNGARSRFNGDGLPGGDAEIDYARPLIVEPVWRRGHPHMFGGGFGLGGFGEPGSEFDESHGFGMGPFGIGAFAVGGGFWRWASPFDWRDGEYAVELRMRDALGNEQPTPLAAITIEIAAPPRPPAKAWLQSLVGPSMTVAWHPSPDFMEN